MKVKKTPKTPAFAGNPNKCLSWANWLICCDTMALYFGLTCTCNTAILWHWGVLTSALRRCPLSQKSANFIYIEQLPVLYKTSENHWRVSITEHRLSSESGQWMVDKWTMDHWSDSRWETAPSGGRWGELSSTTLYSQNVIRQLGWFWCSMPRRATGVCRELRFIALAKILPVCLLAV